MGINVQLFMDEAPVGPVVQMYADKRQRAQDEYVGTLDLNDLLVIYAGNKMR